MPYFPLPRDFPLKTIKHACQDLQGHSRCGGRRTRNRHRHPRPVQHCRRHPRRQRVGGVPSVLVRGAVPPENVDEMARVAAHTNIPIASGERLVTKYEFSELLEKQAAQIIQLDVGQCGGILESKKIAGIAEAHYALIAPHMYVGPVAAAAAVQVDACSPTSSSRSTTATSCTTTSSWSRSASRTASSSRRRGPGSASNSTRKWWPGTVLRPSATRRGRPPWTPAVDEGRMICCAQSAGRCGGGVVARWRAEERRARCGMNVVEPRALALLALLASPIAGACRSAGGSASVEDRARALHAGCLGSSPSRRTS